MILGDPTSLDLDPSLSSISHISLKQMHNAINSTTFVWDRKVGHRFYVKPHWNKNILVPLQQPLSFQILIRLLVDNITLAVLILFLMIRFPSLIELLNLQLFPQRHGVLNLCHISKMCRVGDTQAPHTVSMTPLSKMALECLRPLQKQVYALCIKI